jgi:hypothetical protein
MIYRLCYASLMWVWSPWIEWHHFSW